MVDSLTDRLCHPSRSESGQSPAEVPVTTPYKCLRSPHHVNGIVSFSGSSQVPVSTAHPRSVLADFFIRLHSINTGLATEIFLRSWDEDREGAMTSIGALLYSDNGSHVLESFVRELIQSRENSVGEITRLLMLMHRN